MRRLNAILVILLSVLSWFAVDSETPVQRGGRIISATFTDLKTLNPYLSVDSETPIYSRLFNDGLTRLNPLSQQPEPSLAESWSISPDELEITFRLRRKVRWFDGTPFTAADVLFTMELVNDPEISSVARDALMVEGKSVEWTVVEPFVVRARLPAKHVTFLRHLDPGICPILARHRWEQLYRSGRFAEVLRPAGRIGGLGPFHVKSYRPGEHLTFGRNPNYWKVDNQGIRLPYIDEVTFLILSNQDQVQLKIENDEIDTYQSIRAGDVDSLKQKAKPLKLIVQNVGPTLEMEGLFLNQNRGSNPNTGKPYVDPVKLSWFTDANFRRAVSHAIDRKALVNNVLFGHGIPAFSPESPSNRFWYYPDIPRYSYDVEKARALLKQNGFVEKRNGRNVIKLYDRNGNRVRFSLFTNSGNSIRNIQCTMIVSDLARLGMDVQFRALEFGTLVNAVNRTFQYDAVLLGLNRDDTDPSDRRNMFFSSGAFHFWWPRQQQPFTSWEKQIDELMSLTMSSSNPLQRKKYYDEIQKIFAEQQPMIFTFHPFGFVCFRSGIANMKPTPFKHRTLWNAEELYWEK